MTKVNRKGPQTAALGQALKVATEAPGCHPVSNNQKRIERLSNIGMSTNELSLSSRSSCAAYLKFEDAEDSAILVQMSNQPLALLRKVSIETNNPQVGSPT